MKSIFGAGGLKISALFCALLCWSSQGVAQGAYDSAGFNQQLKTELKLLRITPHGEDVPIRNRQLVFKFDQPVVAVGDMQRNAMDVPIAISPSVECEWLWLDTSSLSCQLTQANRLKKATRYTVVVKPGIETTEGAGMSASVTHRFITERPKLRSVRLEDWARAGKPVAALYFNQPVTRSSVLKSIRINHQERVSVAAEIAFNPWSESHYSQAAPDDEFTSVAALLVNSGAELSKDTRQALAERAVANDSARTLWRISPAKALPANTKVTISVAPGIKSILGRQAGQGKFEPHTFTTLPEFKFIGVDCYSGSTEEYIRLKQEHSAGALLRDETSAKKISHELAECDPQNSASLVFSTPVSYATAKEHLVFSPDLAGDREDYDPWTARNDEYQRNAYFRNRFNRGETDAYQMMLPEALQAYQHYDLTSDSKLVDELGRKITQPVNMSFLTAHRQPRLWYDHRHSVLEKGVDSELPVTVTNLSQLQVNNYSRTTTDTVQSGLGYSRALADVQDIAYKVPLGVRDMLTGKSGVIVGHIDSEPQTPNYHSDYYRFVTQVTPFQVHFKFGHFNSYAWVTDMMTGKPVKGAALKLVMDEYISMDPFSDEDSTTKTDKNGLAMLPGIVDIDPQLAMFNNYRFDEPRWMLKVAKDDDLAILPLDNAYTAWPSISHSLRIKDSYMHAWGTTAQGIYKAGDIIQYKFYVRNQNNQHWVEADKNGYSLEVIDPKGQIIHQVNNLSLSDFGAYAGELKTAETAAVGWYQFKLIYLANDSENGNSDDRSLTLYPMQVLVSDFTPAPFRVSTEINGDQFQAGDTVTVNSTAKMHAGGPYADAETRVTARLKARRFSSAHPEAKGFWFAGESSSGSNTLHQSTDVLNKEGEAVTEFKINDTENDNTMHFGRIIVESAVRDDRGKYVASSTSADYVGRDRFVGLKNTKWVHQVGEAAEVESLLVDARGQPVAGDKVAITVERQVTKAARVKGAGNAYLTQYSTEWVAVSSCALVSTLRPVACEFKPDKPGRYRFVASVQDSKGRRNQNSLSTWVTGAGAVVWGGDNNNQLEIVADAESYKVGDVAKLLIKNPYPGAQALITVERYGVLRHWQKTLKGSTPIIEVPISGDDYPGVYVSVVVTSPRVTQPKGENIAEGNVDLGKPAFKLGYVALPVRDDNKEIAVSIKTNKEVYKPRETVSVNIKAKPRTGKREPIEMAVVVIDESVFDLNRSGENYYDPHHGFNELESLGVANYNLLMQLIGRQKFEKKGANPGGGGAEDGLDFRNLMKFVAYWNPSIELDKRGRGKLEFKLPDNLTGWRVFALAVTKQERMGLGDANFKVNRPTELRPVMPNQLVEGDQIQAGFSVMNRTDQARTIKVEIRAAGDALEQAMSTIVELELEAYQRKRVWMPLTASKPGELAFLATAGDELDGDAVEHHVPVNKRRSLITATTYGTTTQSQLAEKIEFPDGIFSDVGGVSVVVSPSVIGNISGAFQYLRDYPYQCWEQRLSKGLAAAQYGPLKKYLPSDLAWDEATALPIKTLEDAAQFQAPNGGFTYWVNKNDYVSPYLSAYTAIGFNWMREQGYTVPEQVEKRLHDYLRTMLRRDDSSDTEQQRSTRGMRSSIRAVALAALADHGAIDKNDLARYEQHVPDMDLFGKAHFLQAAISLDVNDNKLLDMTRNILSYSAQSGGKFQFNEDVSSGFSTMHHTPMRSDCAILSSLLSATTKSAKALEAVGDVPFKQARAITQTRGGRDYWANTQENIFCMNALLNFSKVYETEAPNMVVNAALQTKKYGSQTIGSTEFTDLRDPLVRLQSDNLPVEPRLAGEVELSKQGQGRLYYRVSMRYAKTEANADRINAGVEIKREYSVQREGQWQKLESPMKLEKGELVRVDIFVSVPAARQFLVIDDPIPGGLEPVNRELATSSSVDAGEDNAILPSTSWWHSRRGWVNYGYYGRSFYHKELRHDSARFFSDYLPEGDYHLNYTAQAIAGGTFSVMPVKAQEMYDPDVYGLGLPAMLDVQQAGLDVQRVEE